MKKEEPKRWIQYRELESTPVEVFVQQIWDCQQVSVYPVSSARIELCITLNLNKPADREWLLCELEGLEMRFGVKNVWFGNVGSNYYKLEKYARENEKAGWPQKLKHYTFDR